MSNTVDLSLFKMFRNLVGRADVPEDRRETLAKGLAQTSGEYSVLPFLAPSIPVNQGEIMAISNHDIMMMPPHVAIHAMRTAASRGTQVVSPRQIPSCTIVKRTHTNAVQTFVHLVASEADPVRMWPRLPGESAPNPSWMSEEPLLKSGRPLAARTPATASPLTYEAHGVSNPFHKAWLKMRANCDFQRRDDVGGDGDALGVAYSKVWGLPHGTFYWPGTVSFAHLTPLKEHAIVVDGAFARTLATIQDRRVVTVAVLTSDSSAFGPDRTVDWTCMRVSCEAKFMLTVTNEHHNLVEMSIAPARMVGNLGPPPRPAGVVAYHPNYATAWYYGSDSFSINPVGAEGMVGAPLTPVAASEFGAGGLAAANGAILALYSVGLRLVQTALNRMEETGESAFTTGIVTIANAVSNTRSAARTGNRALTSWLYDSIIGAPSLVKVKFLRTLMAVTTSLTALDTELRADGRLVSDLAANAVQLDGCIAMRMATMAATRGESVDTWYMELIRQIPRDMVDTAPNTRAWAWTAMYFTLFPPNRAWFGLLAALRANAAEIMTPGASTLPEYEGLVASEGRTAALTRARITLASHKALYHASYDGAAKAGLIMARLCGRQHREGLRKAFRASSFCWTLRARAIRSVNVHMSSLLKEYPPNSLVREFDATEEGQYFPVSIWVTIAPYTAYRAWKKGCDAEGTPTARMCSETVEDGKVTQELSNAANSFGRLMVADRETYDAIVADPPNALRYAVDASRLGPDIESFLTFTMADAVAAVRAVWRTMMPPLLFDAGAAEAAADMAFEAAVAAEGAPDPFGVEDDGELSENEPQNGWFWMSKLDQVVGDSIMDAMDENDAIAQALEALHASLDEFDQAIYSAFEGAADDPSRAGNVLI